MTKFIRKDTWHYRLWDLTFIFSSNPYYRPRSTYTCLYWPRIILLTVPALVWACVCAVVAGIAVIVANVLTIVAGFGVWMPWRQWPNTFLHFPLLRTGGQSIPIWFFLVPLWTVAVLWGGWSWYSGPLWATTSFILTYGLYAVAVVAAIVICYFLYHLAGFLKELLEEKTCEHVVFEDPPEEPQPAPS